MSRVCPKCKSLLNTHTKISLLFSFKARCLHCSSRLRNSLLWMFFLSILVVFTTIASLSFVNWLGPKGFILAGILPICLFFMGTYFAPLSVE